MILPLVLAFVIVMGNYLSEIVPLHRFKYKSYLISFVAGISVTYIFLHLLPELYEGVNQYNKSLFIFVLIGFAMFHLIEKFIYQRARKNKIPEDLMLNHALSLFLYDLSIGIVLVNFFRISNIDGWLFFIPIFSHAALSSLSINKIHNLNKKRVLKNKFLKFVLYGGSLYGALIATFYIVSSKVSFTLMGLVAGILLYVVIRETIPSYKKGNPLTFILGVVLYSLLIFFTWLFF
jgi:zinc transporter ZupT|tara:strand:- start:306 stop:1007 length:702 start_codon:yes stop_codon:yes gene_type:complete